MTPDRNTVARLVQDNLPAHLKLVELEIEVTEDETEDVYHVTAGGRDDQAAPASTRAEASRAVSRILGILAAIVALIVVRYMFGS